MTDFNDVEGIRGKPDEAPGGMEGIGDEPARDPIDEGGPGGMNAIPPSSEDPAEKQSPRKRA